MNWAAAQSSALGHSSPTIGIRTGSKHHGRKFSLSLAEERSHHLEYKGSVQQHVRGFGDLAINNPQNITITTSVLEGRGEAIFLQPSQAKVDVRCHIHANDDATFQMTVSFADSKEVISKGWGERHKSSRNILPLFYILLYAPRDEAEIDVANDSTRAGIKFITVGRDVR